MGNKTQRIKQYFTTNYIAVFLFVVFVGFIMSFFSIHAEKVRQETSDYSERWSVNGEIVDTDSIVTYKYGDKVTLTNTLPVVIGYNESLCFMTNNVFLDVYIGQEHVYSYTQPVNFSGYGYGTAYHAVNLSPDMAGKPIRIDMRGVFPKKTTGQIRMISIEDSREYYSRLARGQILSFLISAGIALLGILLLFFKLIVKNRGGRINIVALGLTAIFTGGWLAVDTGFLRLVTGNVILSRTLSYIFMHFCFLPLIMFVYSITRAKKKGIQIAAHVISAAYYMLVLISRFIFNIDMASNAMLVYFFIYALIMLGLLGYMIVLDRRLYAGSGIKRNVSFFTVGITVNVICAVIDCSIYLSGVRSISGYANFSRVGFFVFFLNMCIEVVRIWVREYALLKESGFEDALTEVGNRRSYVEFDKKNREIYPYGFIMCDINALKRENDVNGHEAGDLLIKRVASRLVEVFGVQNVFRVGGDEFFVYSFEQTESAFNDRIKVIRRLLSEDDCSASVGGVYVSDASIDRSEAKKKAEELMYAEKDRYYASHDDRRR